MDGEQASSSYFREYEAAGAADTLVDGPRFGRSRDFTDLFASDEEASDYVVGLLVAGVICAALFLTWMLLILIFLCLGRDRVGFLSGAPFDRKRRYSKAKQSASPQPSTDGSLQEEFNNEVEATNTVSRKRKGGGCCGGTTPVWIRGSFILSGIIFILFSILLVTQGITNLQQTVETMDQSAVDVQLLASEASAILQEGLLDVQPVAASLRDALVAELQRDNFCPGDPDLEQSATAQDVRDVATTAVDALTALDEFVTEQADDIALAVEKVEKGAAQIHDVTGDVDVTDWEALLILIFYTIVPCVLVAATILAHYDVDVSGSGLVCIINWFFLPLFILMVIVAAGTASGMIIAASANSDFCLPGGRAEIDDNQLSEFFVRTNSPDYTLMRILERSGYKPEDTDMVYKVANYYVQQCQSKVEDPFVFLKEHMPELQESKRTVEQLEQNFQEDATVLELSLYCNREFDDLEQLLADMGTVLHKLTEAANRTLGLVECDNIVPIYHRAVYDGACLYSVSAVFWVFSCALILAFFGLIMITFRSAYKLSTLYDDKDTEHSVVDFDATTEVPRQKGPGDEVIREVDASPSAIENYGIPPTTTGGDLNHSHSSGGSNPYYDHDRNPDPLY